MNTTGKLCVRSVMTQRYWFMTTNWWKDMGTQVDWVPASTSVCFSPTQELRSGVGPHWLFFRF